MQMLVFENFVIKSHAGSRQKESAAAKPAKGIIFKLKNNEKKIFCALDGCCGVGLVCLRWVSHL